jgi:phage repressor protein C with HTH and peptisase S24 domain
MVVASASRLPPMAFTKRWMVERGIKGREALRFCKVIGPSMEPELHDGDVVMVETTQTQVIDGSIYAIQYGSEIRVRKLFSTLGSGLRVHCANPGFPDEVIDPAMGSFKVLGRVVWRGG